jgi:hypothetical protein
MGIVIGLLFAGSVLVIVCWLGSERRQVDRVAAAGPPVHPGSAAPPRPAPAPIRFGVATAAVIAHPDGIPSIGRHDDRRCSH